MRKGMAQITFMIGVIVLIAFLFLILIFQGEIVKLLMGASTENLCKTSVHTHSYAKLGGKDLIGKIGLDCPTKYIKITKEKQVKPTIARELFECWDNFGAGKLELFDHRSDSYFTSDRDIFCVPCAVIEFKGMDGTVPGLMKYLVRTPAPGKDMSVFEFLNGVRFDKVAETEIEKEFAKLDKRGINVTAPFSITFMYGKDSRIGRTEATMYGVALGSGLAIVGVTIAVFTVGWGVIPIVGIAVPGLLGGGLGLATAATVTGSVAGGAVGYMMGSDTSAKWDAKLLVGPYERDALFNFDKQGSDDKKKFKCKELPIGVKDVEVEPVD